MAQSRVFNLDSEVQLAKWLELHAAAPDFWAGPCGALDTVRGDDRAAQRWFGGVLRTGVLFAQQLILTDAQLLDGVFFQSFTAQGTLELLGMPLSERPALRIYTRAATIEESLRRFATTADGRRLRFVIWSSVLPCLPEGTDPGCAFRALEGRPADRVADAPAGTVAHEIAALLEEGLGLTRGTLRGLAAAWQSWIDADVAGLVETAPLELPDRALFESRMRRHLSSEGVGLPHDTLRPIHEQPDRSHARTAIDDLEVDSEQKRRLHVAYADAYSLALSESCGADVWLKIDAADTDGGDTSGGPLRAGQLALAGAATVQLGDMTPARFQTLRYEARDAIAAWQERADPVATREIAYQVRVASERGDVRSQRQAVRTRALMVAGLALVAFVLDLVPELDGRWTVLSLGAALLVGVLPEAVASWRDYRNLGDGRLSSVIKLTKG